VYAIQLASSPRSPAEVLFISKRFIVCGRSAVRRLACSVITEIITSGHQAFLRGHPLSPRGGVWHPRSSARLRSPPEAVTCLASRSGERGHQRCVDRHRVARGYGWKDMVRRLGFPPLHAAVEKGAYSGLDLSRIQRLTVANRTKSRS
jgi:hypothetical protein